MAKRLPYYTERLFHPLANLLTKKEILSFTDAGLVIACTETHEYHVVTKALVTCLDAKVSKISLVGNI